MVPDAAAPATVLVATTNPHKVAEFAGILAGLPVRLITLAEAGITAEVEETGTTFAANAAQKARGYHAAARARGLPVWVLADDSGLEVDALGGEPGVYSTRWAGPGTTAEERNVRLLARLCDVPADARGARFRCVIVLISPTGAEYVGEGTVEGRIGFAPRRREGWGFGYDPIFELPERGLTIAELPPEAKAAISHRGRAGRQIRAILAAALNGGAGAGAGEGVPEAAADQRQADDDGEKDRPDQHDDAEQHGDNAHQ